MTEKEARKLYKEYQTPSHVIKHCEKVAYVGVKIADAYKDAGKEIDIETLKNACLLHDLLRVIDFNADPEYEEIQLELKEKYPDMTHSEAAYALLNEKGETTLANIIKKHAFDGIIDPENQPFTLEEKIMTYADKRVLHDDIVSLSERFEDGRRRYNPHNINTEWEQTIYDAYFQLEKELFKDISLDPEDIK